MLLILQTIKYISQIIMCTKGRDLTTESRGRSFDIVSIKQIYNATRNYLNILPEAYQLVKGDMLLILPNTHYLPVTRFITRSSEHHHNDWQHLSYIFHSFSLCYVMLLCLFRPKRKKTYFPNLTVFTDKTCPN